MSQSQSASARSSQSHAKCQSRPETVGVGQSRSEAARGGQRQTLAAGVSQSSPKTLSDSQIRSVIVSRRQSKPDSQSQSESIAVGQTQPETFGRSQGLSETVRFSRSEPVIINQIQAANKPANQTVSRRVKDKQLHHSESVIFNQRHPESANSCESYKRSQNQFAHQPARAASNQSESAWANQQTRDRRRQAGAVIIIQKHSEVVRFRGSQKQLVTGRQSRRQPQQANQIQFKAKQTLRDREKDSATQVKDRVRKTTNQL